jgi:cellulose synthase/poly-beta-1,6-N-acetylglucosamine synthase-like glycosyltransferase
MTFLFPLITAACRTRRSQRIDSAPLPQKISILIPAHNEERLLPGTLNSIFQAIEATKSGWPCIFRILVGADGCTDKTEQIATSMGAELLTMPAKTGKWGTLCTLVATCSNTDWTILADSGVTWPRDFLLRLQPLLLEKDAIGVAPTYRNNTSGPVEQLIWGLESIIKRLEGQSGGPVSVHGATVCYRTKELGEALRLLSSRHWLNDDIVIPLTLRALYPGQHISYVASLAVSEAEKPKCPKASEFRRRRRLVLGNVQWITFLWGPVWLRNSSAALLAGRRIFRLLWVYWGASACLTIASCSGIFALPLPYLLTLTAIMLVLVLRIAQLRVLLESGLASALAPYYLLFAVLSPPFASQDTKWN